SKSFKLANDAIINKSESESSNLQTFQDIEIYNLTIAEDETNLSGTFKSDEITVSEVDKLLAEIYTNIVSLTKDESIKVCDYHIAFKEEKAKGART
ncbi:19053_t:CDS:2, partial [Dentiscutata erythropus]